MRNPHVSELVFSDRYWGCDLNAVLVCKPILNHETSDTELRLGVDADLDRVLLRYSREVLRSRGQALDGVFVTHMDSWQRAGSLIVDAYDIDGNRIENLELPGNLDEQQQLTVRLARATVVRSAAECDAPELICEALAAPLLGTSWSGCSSGVQWITS